MGSKRSTPARSWATSVAEKRATMAVTSSAAIHSGRPIAVHGTSCSAAFSSYLRAAATRKTAQSSATVQMPIANQRAVVTGENAVPPPCCAMLRAPLYRLSPSSPNASYISRRRSSESTSYAAATCENLSRVSSPLRSGCSRREAAR